MLLEYPNKFPSSTKNKSQKFIKCSPPLKNALKEKIIANFTKYRHPGYNKIICYCNLLKIFGRTMGPINRKLLCFPSVIGTNLILKSSRKMDFTLLDLVKVAKYKLKHVEKLRPYLETYFEIPIKMIL